MISNKAYGPSCTKLALVSSYLRFACSCINSEGNEVAVPKCIAWVFRLEKLAPSVWREVTTNDSDFRIVLQDIFTGHDRSSKNGDKEASLFDFTFVMPQQVPSSRKDNGILKWSKNTVFNKSARRLFSMNNVVIIIHVFCVKCRELTHHVLLRCGGKTFS
jgi:hypothetical protein